MLVLGRKVSDGNREREKILIDPGGLNIEVELLKIDPNGSIRVGIAAPKHIAVHRNEYWERLQAEAATR